MGWSVRGGNFFSTGGLARARRVAALDRGQVRADLLGRAVALGAAQVGRARPHRAAAAGRRVGSRVGFRVAPLGKVQEAAERVFGLPEVLGEGGLVRARAPARFAHQRVLERHQRALARRAPVSTHTTNNP